MTKWRTNIPKWLRQSKEWNEWESALVFATVWPRLLAPNNRKRRSQIRTLHYLALLEQMAGAKGRRAALVRDFVIKRLQSRLMDLAHTARIEWYRQQLFLDATAGSYITPILTTGVLVKVLASPNGIRHGRRVVSAATEFLVANHRRGIAIVGDEDKAEESWRKWKHAAHLCAALVDYLPRDSTPQINDATLRQIEADMASFITTALHYQKFLTGHLEPKGVGIPAATRRSFKLASLDPIELSAPGFAKDDLPAWDRKRGVST